MSTTPRHVQQLFDLKGRTALVTGGSRGLGLQIAHALGEAGARLLISSRKTSDLEEAAAELREAGHEVDWVAADVARDEDVVALAEQAMERLGHVDILVNNAGTTWGAPAEEYPLDGWDKVMNLNLRGLFRLTQEIGRRSMIPRAYGRIINIASVAALGGNPDIMKAVGYNTSKGAVVAFTRALSSEWGPHNITINAIGPGLFPSRMSKHLFEVQGGMENIVRNIPMRRVGDEEALKGAVMLFASDAGKHITGQFLPVDGGSSAMIASA